MRHGIACHIHRGHFQVLHVNRRLFRRVAWLSAFLPALLVCGKVKRDEEEKIGTEDGHSRERGKLFSRALALVRHVWEVFRGEIRV